MWREKKQEVYFHLRAWFAKSHRLVDQEEKRILLARQLTITGLHFFQRPERARDGHMMMETIL
jgi:hemolysin activation/secretion protein